MTVRAVGILASAGTGKTYRLTGELLQLLLGGRPPQSVFAATFTRTAAAEILERVLRRLCDAAQSKPGLDELRRAIGRPDLSAEECRRCAATLGRSLDRLAVWTLDAFLVRVATAFSVEIGLAPGWRVAEDDENAAIQRAAVGRVLREAGTPVVLPLLRMLKKSEGQRSVHESIFSIVTSLHEVHVQTTPDAWSAVQPHGSTLDDAALASSLELLSSAPVAQTKAGKPHASWVKALRAAVQHVTDRDWDGFLANGMVLAALGKQNYYRLPAPAQLAEICGHLGRHAHGVLITQLCNQNRAAEELVRRFDVAYTDLKRSLGAVRFEEIPRLLASRTADRMRDELYYRLDARLEHVLLDEFQDTSVAQFRVVEPIIAELVSDETRDRSFFYVGDAKQSLFGWRHAEPMLLGHLGRKWPQIKVEPLARSFRSSPVIINTVNKVFAGLANSPCLQSTEGRAAAQEWAELYHEHSCDHSVANLPGHVVLRRYPRLAPKEPPDSLTDDRCRFIADRVADIARTAPLATIGVLMRTKRWVPRIVMELADRGLEATEEGGSPLVQSPAVAAIVSLLRLADHPGDRLAAFHVSTTALGALIGLDRSVEPAAVAEVSRHLRGELTRRGVAQVVGEWARWLAPVCSDIDRTRLDQAVQLAEAYQLRGSSSLRGLVEMIELARRPVGQPARIRVMTIHAAKGLEFDAVVVPELDGKVPSMSPEVLYSRDDVLGPITRISLNASEAVCLAGGPIAELASSRRQREIREALCLLYVAMTRARRYLEMIVFPNEGDSFKLSRVVKAALTENTPVTSEGEPDAEDSEQDADGESVVLHEHNDGEWHRGIKGEQSPAPQPSPARVLRLAQNRPLSRSASDLDEHSAPATYSAQEASPATALTSEHSQPLLFQDSAPAAPAPPHVRRAARGLGIAVHACLESIAWLDSGEPSDEHFLRLIREVGLPFDVSEHEVVRSVRAVLASPAISALLRIGRYAPGAPGRHVSLQREVAGAGTADAARDATISDQTLFRGRLDRLVIVRDHGVPVSAEIIDWKTDGLTALARGANPAVNSNPAAYQSQLETYAAIVGRTLGIPRSNIRATVAFVASGLVHSYDPA